MEIGFSSSKFAKLCTDPSTRARKLGKERARKLLLRLDQLSASENLAKFHELPQARCHQLSADRDEQFSCDLDGPFRLIFEIAHDPPPRKPDGGFDLQAVTRIVLVDIVDTH